MFGANKKKMRYIELVLISVVLGVLIFLFDWPSYLFIVLAFGFFINLFVIELKFKK